MVYFSEQQVKQLFLELVKRFKGAQICFDTYSGWLVNKSVSTHSTTDQMRKNDKWRCDNIKQPEIGSSDLTHLSTTDFLKLYPKRWGIYPLVRFFLKIANCSSMSVF